ncbi:MAG: flagellar basal body rod protein FlgB [Planctomycetaceae bacterium]|nr:flagellar basal body rod protein FlgB [Planctomycetaceae bacterium]
MLGFPKQTELLTRLMEASELRHRVVSQNLANVNTPGYRRLKVDFEDELAQQILSGDSDAEPPVINTEVVEDKSRTPRADGNTVDIDLEIGELQRNAMMYQTYAQLLSAQFATMRLAISAE